MSEQPFPEVEVKHALECALDALCKADIHLLHVNSSERSMTHRLAVHLEPYFPDHAVDCEYNRDGSNVKRLKPSDRDAKSDDLDAVTVFPDIVVHKRGNNEGNLLVIEVKKGSSSASPDYDFQKLGAFKTELHYAHAVHVTIGFAKDGKLVRHVVWLDG